MKTLFLIWAPLFLVGCFLAALLLSVNKFEAPRPQKRSQLP